VDNEVSEPSIRAIYQSSKSAILSTFQKIFALVTKYRYKKALKLSEKHN